MVRTHDEILNSLTKLAPRWMLGSIGTLLFSGLASVILKAELAFDSWLPELLKETATDSLISHGEEAGVTRDPWESENSFRCRAISEPRGPTPEFLEREANRVAFSGMDGYRVEFHEPLLDVADVDCFADHTRLRPTHPRYKYEILVEIPIAEPRRNEGFFADLNFSDLNFCNPTPFFEGRDSFRRTFAVIEKYRPAGVRASAEIVDSLQLAHALNFNLFEVLH